LLLGVVSLCAVAVAVAVSHCKAVKAVTAAVELQNKWW
jgi:hypothetical protein